MGIGYILMYWSNVKPYALMLLYIKKMRKRKEKEQIKGNKMPQSEWWKQCIWVVLEIRMHEYVENIVNRKSDFILWLHGLSKLGGKV